MNLDTFLSGGRWIEICFYGSWENRYAWPESNIFIINHEFENNLVEDKKIIHSLCYLTNLQWREIQPTPERPEPKWWKEKPIFSVGKLIKKPDGFVILRTSIEHRAIVQTNYQWANVTIDDEEPIWHLCCHNWREIEEWDAKYGESK